MAVVNYDWDEIEDNIDEEYDDSGISMTEYSSEPYVYGGLTSQYLGGQTSYYHYDGSGSAVNLTNDSGSETDSRSYTLFGEIAESTGTTTFVFQYVGLRGYASDEGLATYYVRRRILVPTAGRWLSPDPAPAPNDVNLYIYASNSPSDSDPSGTGPLCDCVRVLPPAWVLPSCLPGWAYPAALPYAGYCTSKSGKVLVSVCCAAFGPTPCSGFEFYLCWFGAPIFLFSTSSCRL